MAGTKLPLVLLTLAALAVPAQRGLAQVGRTHPDRGYFLALDEVASGSYRRAERAMRGEIRSAVRFGTVRWIDSIMYTSGLGEALYHQGRLPESLEQFNLAIDLFLSQPDWMNKVRFQQPPRQDNSLARRLPPWATPAGRVAYARMPRSFLILIGNPNNTVVTQNGGTLQQATFWKLDAEELSRSIAWTLYRRSQLLGSLGAHDSRTAAVANRLAGGGLGPGGHWSSAWTELWWGLASAGKGDAIQAMPHLEQSMRLGGQLTHRLSGIAWLARGKLAVGAGDPDGASQAFQQAIQAAVAYEDIQVLVEATRAWHEIASYNRKIPPPPAPALADWSERQGHWQLSVAARLAMIERAILDGETAAARGAIKQAFRRADDAADGLLGREGDRLLAIAAAAASDDALRLAQQTITKQAAMSRRRMQVQIANGWHASGKLSPRLAKQVYAILLEDPNAGAWITDPLDGLAWMATPETEAFERWFASAEDGRDALLALKIIDRQRRREFFASQPMAGRLTAVRWLLEAPDELLPPGAIDPRARLDSPAYRNLRQQGEAAAGKLKAAIDQLDDSITSAVRKAEKELRQSVDGRERLVLRAALSRVPTPLAFPPPIDPAGAKQQLVAGEALLAFHEMGNELYGVVLTSGGEHLWRIGPTKQVAAQVERLLTETVGISPRQTWSTAELAEAKWKAPADELSTLLLGGSRLDGATLERLWVVPVGSLWRAPFGLLSLPVEGGEAVRLSDLTTTIAPTPGWAMRRRLPPAEAVIERPVWSLAAASAKAQEFEGEDPLGQIAKATSPPRGLEASTEITKAIASAAVIDLGGQPIAADPLGTDLTTADAGRREVRAWSRLPYAGTKTVAVLNQAGGEAGGGKPRRSKNAPSVGAAELHATCAMLAGGAESILLERWPTRGVRSRELVGEWLNGVGRLQPAEAWKRSLALGRTRPLDASREPRLEIETGDVPTAEHPFWWSGYLLID